MPTPQDLFPETEISVRGAKRKFANFAELTDFWTHERNLFRPLLESSRARHINPSAQFLAQMLGRQNTVDAQISEVASLLQRYPSDIVDPQRHELQTRLKGLAGNIISALGAVFAEDAFGTWLSSEPAAQFILELAKTNRDEAAFALLYLHGTDFSDESFAAKSGAIKAHFFESNVTSLRGDAEAAAIKSITEMWQRESSKMVSEIEANRRAASELNEVHIKAIAEQGVDAKQRTADFQQFLAARLEENTTQLAASREELTKLAATYDQHMKLQAPVDYWRKKKERHLGERTNLKRWTISIGLISFAVLGAYVWFNFHEGKAGVVPWREIVGFFVLSSLAFWAVKILVRLLLSSIHLAEDAAEREVMAMTYMALVRGDGSTTKYMNESDRALVLGPLFRPSATGVIDDGAPPHVSEIITKIGR